MGENSIEEFKKIKVESTKNLVIFGSPTVVGLLTEHNLIDEYYIFIAPIILGGGQKLFSNTYSMKKLNLLDSKQLDGGSVVYITLNKSQPKNMFTPSQLIDEQIAKLDDWRGSIMAKFRELVSQTAPELTEDWKWKTGVWVYNKKPVIAFSSFKDHVKFNFFRGSELTRQAKFFNNGLDSKQHRSVDIFKTDKVDKSALKEIILAALELEKNN